MSTLSSVSIDTPFELLLQIRSIAGIYGGSKNGVFGAPKINYAYLPRPMTSSFGSQLAVSLTEGLTTRDLKRIVFDFTSTKRGHSEETIQHEYFHALGYNEEEVIQILGSMTEGEINMFSPIFDAVFANIEEAFSAFSQVVLAAENSSKKHFEELKSLICVVEECGLPSLMVDPEDSFGFILY